MMRPALTPEAREKPVNSISNRSGRAAVKRWDSFFTGYYPLFETGVNKKERVEKEILEKQKELIEAKTQNLKMAERTDELWR